MELTAHNCDQFDCGRVLYGHIPGIEHSAGSGVALAVGDAALVARVLAAGPAAADTPVDMTDVVGCSNVFTAPLFEPADVRPGSGATLTIRADAITAQLLIAARSFAFIFFLPSACGIPITHRRESGLNLG